MSDDPDHPASGERARPRTRTAGESGGIRYIGSKSRVVQELSAILGQPQQSDGVFVDGFCGTGVVAEAAATLGWSVRVNDHLLSSTSLAVARLLSPEDVPFVKVGGYPVALRALNDAPPISGFFWREYSPASDLRRMYFTEDTARRIDAARSLITEWRTSGMISQDEYSLLTADLIVAAARVANIAGTYGCFLTHWSGAARRSFRIEPRRLRTTQVEHEAHSVDVLDVPIAECDVAYFDPPYTKRQYAAYYHINETLAYGDEPDLIGRTGLRPWREKASDYCYKVRALPALRNLIENTPAKRILLSYSDEGHVPLADLTAALTPLGDLHIHELRAIGRYRPNRSASERAGQVTEFVIELQRRDVRLEATELVA